MQSCKFGGILSRPAPHLLRDNSEEKEGTEAQLFIGRGKRGHLPVTRLLLRQEAETFGNTGSPWAEAGPWQGDPRNGVEGPRVLLRNAKYSHLLGKPRRCGARRSVLDAGATGIHRGSRAQAALLSRQRLQGDPPTLSEADQEEELEHQTSHLGLTM